MRTLTLFRHAKSSWDDPSLADFDRPLNPRGRKAAPAMGRHMRKLGLIPDLVLCSPAVRTRETARLALGELGVEPTTEFPEDIYEATAETLLARLQKVPKKHRHVLLIGHNPGLHDLALGLLANPPAGASGDLAIKMPTAALTVLACDITKWSDLTWHSAKLEHYQTPRRLG
ncbi:MAG: histidine phosphatase family protein [Hyphomicrobiaceae bacterium]